MNDNRDYRELICHGNAERCFKIGRWRMPVCARCFSIYTGIGVGILSSLFVNISYLSSTFLFFLTISLLLPLVIDGSLQRLTQWESENWIRTVTGGPLGILLGIDIIWILLELRLI